MAVREIKTTIALDGEKEFKRSIEDANREMRVMGAELRNLASEFDITGASQQYYTRKSDALEREMKQQKNIVKALENAVKDMGKIHGESSREVQDMTIQLTNARTKLNRLQKEFNDNEKAATDFGKDLDKHVEKEAKQAGKAIDGLKNDLGGLDGELGGIRGALDGLKTLTGIDLGMEMFGQIPDWVSQVMSWSEEGRDWARTNARFTQTAEWAGIDEAVANEQLNRVAAVLGDREQATTGIQQLLTMQGLQNEDLAPIVDNILGAALANADLSFEGLLSDFQESASKGEASGQYGELLERSGMTGEQIDALNESLKAEQTQRGRMMVLLTALTQSRQNGISYVDFLREYTTENAQLIKAEDVHQQAQQAWEELKSGDLAQAFSTGVDLLSLSLVNAEKAAELTPAAQYWGEHKPQNWFEEWAIEKAEAPRVGYDPAAVPEKRTFGITMGQVFGTRNEWGELWTDYTKRTGIEKKDAILDLYGKYGGYNTTNAPDLGGFGFGGFGGSFVDTPLPPETQSLPAAPDLSSVLQDSLQDAATEAQTNFGNTAEQLGVDLGADLGAGISEGGKSALAAAQEIVDGLNTILEGIVIPQIAIPVTGGAGAFPTAGAGKGNVYLDGRKVGQIISPTVNQTLGRMGR